MAIVDKLTINYSAMHPAENGKNGRFEVSLVKLSNDVPTGPPGLGHKFWTSQEEKSGLCRDVSLHSRLISVACGGASAILVSAYRPSRSVNLQFAFQNDRQIKPEREL